MALPTPSDWLTNKRLFRWHGWIGLNLGLLLFLICFSGTVAVFSWEIDWGLDPAMRAEADSVHWTAIEDSIEAEYPNHVVTVLAGPRHDGFAALAYAKDPAGRFVKLWVHPETGTVQKRGSFWTVQRFLRSFHRRMLIPNPVGILWVTFFAFILAGSAITGILFYRDWYRNLFRWRWHDVRLLFSDGHRLAGVWGLPFAALIVATSVWYGVELLAPAPSGPTGTIGQDAKVERGPTPHLLPLGEQVARAKAAFPGLSVQDVVPGTATRPTLVRGHADAWVVRPRANTVRVDPVTGAVRSVQRGTDLGLHHRIADMADPLHFGTFGGLWSQVLWGLFGLLLSSLMLTGGWLWHLRAEKKARAAGADSRHPRWGYAAAALPVIVLLASAVFGYLEVENYYWKSDAPRQVEATTHTIGPWQARLLRMTPPDTPQSPMYRVLFEGPDGATGNLKAATLRWTGTPDSTAASLHPKVPVTEILRGDAVQPAASLAVTATTWDGHTHRDTIATPDAGPVASTVRATALPIPPVPTGVWVVIGLFSTLVVGIVGGWLIVAQRTARRRAERDASTQERKGETVPVSADLPGPPQR
jgi:uncharacterized iron-regulated membrane protein